MSDAPVRTRVLARDRWWPLQEFMIKGRGEGPVDGVDFRGVAAAGATPEVLDAIATARAIVIGPSNPVISIRPILETRGIRDALTDARAPVIAVSPLVGGQVLKGPTAAFMEWSGQPLSADGIASVYDGVIDGLVADDRTELVPLLQDDVLLNTPAERVRVAEATLQFALELRA
jgi:LPPG:FO 2-phospho-L-lactate transferase